MKQNQNEPESGEPVPVKYRRHEDVPRKMRVLMERTNAECYRILIEEMSNHPSMTALDATKRMPMQFNIYVGAQKEVCKRTGICYHNVGAFYVLRGFLKLMEKTTEIIGARDLFSETLNVEDYHNEN